MLTEKIPQISFDLKLDKANEEVKTWTVIDYLALGSIEIPDECLNLVQASVQISVQSSGLLYESQGLLIQDNKLILD